MQKPRISNDVSKEWECERESFKKGGMLVAWLP